MATCLQCKEFYHAVNEDAGSYRDSFCSLECGEVYEDELEAHIQAEDASTAAAMTPVDPDTGEIPF